MIPIGEFEKDSIVPFIDHVLAFLLSKLPHQGKLQNPSQKDFIKYVCIRAYKKTSYLDLLDSVCISQELFERLRENFKVVINTMHKIKQNQDPMEQDKTFVGGLDKVMIEAILEFFGEQKNNIPLEMKESIITLNEECNNLISNEDLTALLIAIEILGKHINQVSLINLLVYEKKPSLAPALWDKEIDDFVGNLKHYKEDLLKRVLRKLIQKDIIFVLKNKGNYVCLKEKGTALISPLIAHKVATQIKETYKKNPDIFNSILKYSAKIQSCIIRFLDDIDYKKYLNFTRKNKGKLSFEGLGESLVQLGKLPDKDIIPFYQELLNPCELSYTRKCICQGLSHKSSSERLQILGTIAKFEKNPGVKISAIDALGAIEKKEILPILQNLNQTNKNQIQIVNAIQRATERIEKSANGNI